MGGSEQGDTRAGGALLLIAGVLLTGGSVWHLAVFRGANNAAALAEAIARVPLWAHGHFVLALGFAILAAANFLLMPARTAPGASAATRLALAYLFVGALGMVMADAIDGFVGAALAPSVVAGRDEAVFNALFELDRAFEVLGLGLVGVGGATLAIVQLRRPTVLPGRASVVGLIGMGGLMVAGPLGRGLLLGPLAIGFVGSVPAFVWLTALGAGLARGTSPARAAHHPAA